LDTILEFKLKLLELLYNTGVSKLFSVDLRESRFLDNGWSVHSSILASLVTFPDKNVNKFGNHSNLH